MKAIADQTILVTGSTDGIGKQTAHDLANMGATVLLHGRNQAQGESVLEEIRSATGNDNLHYYRADLSSLAEIHDLAEVIQAKHNKLDGLINNAGIGAGKRTDTARALSHDGYELRFAVNYLAPFYSPICFCLVCITKRLLALLMLLLSVKARSTLKMSC